MAKRIEIEPGQVFRETGTGFLGRNAMDWVVTDIFTGVDGLRYARLTADGQPSIGKTLSVSVLGDKRRFAPVLRSNPERAGEIR